MDKIIHIPGFDLKITRRLIVDLSLHFFVTMVMCVCVFIYTRNIVWAILVFTGGILIDTDHFLDYFIHIDKWDLHSFLHGKFVISKKLYLVFHAWEIVILFYILSLTWSFFYPLALGMTGHLIIDKLMHARHSPLAYFIFYRWKHDFLFDKFNYYQFERQMKSLRKAGLLEEKQKTEDKDSKLS